MYTITHYSDDKTATSSMRESRHDALQLAIDLANASPAGHEIYVSDSMCNTVIVAYGGVRNWIG